MAKADKPNVIFRRISKLIEKAHKNSPKEDFDVAKIREAVKWSADRIKTRKFSEIERGQFPDPLAVAELLADDPENLVNNEMLIAAITYPSVRPKGGDIRADDHGIAQIADIFGRTVSDIVKSTLQLHALDKILLKPRPLEAFDPDKEAPDEFKRRKEAHEKAEKDRFEKYNAKFLLMSLWQCPRREAVGIRAADFLVTLNDRIERAVDRLGMRRPNDTGPSKDDDKFFATKGRDVMAPLALLAGYKNLYEEIDDGVLELEHPELYATIGRATSNVGGAQIKKEHLPHYVNYVQKALKSAGIAEGHYVIFSRIKRPGSVYKKILAKEQTVEQLGDLRGIKVVILKEAFFDETQDERKVEREADRAVHIATAPIIAKLGRGNPSPEYRREFDKIAKLDPVKNHPELMRKIAGLEAKYNEIAPPKDVPKSEISLELKAELKDITRQMNYIKSQLRTLDCRDDDYYKAPRNEYKAVHASILIPHHATPGILAVFELQGLDEIQKIKNETDPDISHDIYKTKVNGTLYKEWQNNNREVTYGRPSNLPGIFVYVVTPDDDHEILYVETNSLGGFIKAQHGNISMKKHVVAALVDNIDPFITSPKGDSVFTNKPLRDGERQLTSPHAPIYNADRIKRLEILKA